LLAGDIVAVCDFFFQKIVNTIGQWLEQLGLTQYSGAFVENDIDESVLPDLTDSDLKELGIRSLGHRKILLKAIASLQTGASAPPSFPVEATVAISDAEHRQLTVMFCDLVGSTELTQRLDPEDLRDVNRAYQDACRAAIERFDGYVARYMGDGVLAYFGYPQAHEDDAERAVRAGLGIVASMDKLSAEVGKPHAVVLEARLGIATGAVVVGDIIGEGASEEAAVVGETPNLAARLQSLAGSNQVVVASATHQLVGELFEYDDLGIHTLKGIANPVRAWQVTREGDVGSRYEAKHVGGRLPLVGRQEELGLLLRSWEASKEGHGQAVLIQGEAGIGKSRLLEALRERVSSENHIWVAHWCSPYHANSTLYPVIEHLKRVMGWKPEDANEEKLEKLEMALESQSLPLQEAVPLYAPLMSLPLPEGRYAPLELSAKQQREETLDSLAAWLLDEAERKPVLNVWEDLHWADPTTLELLGLYIEQSPTVSMLDVLTYRPEFAPPWSMHSHMTPITLNRMERPEVESLIGHQASGKQMPPEVIEHIVEKADGVPLFVEELTKTVLESDFLREEEYSYTLAGSLSELAIPATLQDSLMARLDRFPTLRELAQLGAVLGREFSYVMLQPLTPLDERDLADGLGHLVENELLYQRGRPPRSRYIFKHALIQDAAYQSLLRRTRQKYHEQVAKLIVERFPEMLASQPELIAHHYARAGCYEEAVDYFQQAGQDALVRWANVEAATHLDKALECLRQLPESPACLERELELQMTLGPAAVQGRGFGHPDVGHAYARAWDLCRQLGNETHLPIALRGLQIFRLITGELKDSQEFAKQLLELAERQDDPALVVGGCHALGQTTFFLGDLSHARKFTERGIGIFDAGKHRLSNWPGGQPGEQCFLYSAFTLWMLGYPEQALRRCEQALRLANELSNPANLVNTLAFITTLHVMRKDLESGLRQAEATIKLGSEQGNPTFLGQGMILRGWLQVVQNPAGDGISELDRGLAIFRSVVARSWVPYVLGLEAESYVRMKRFDDGHASIAEAIAIAESANLGARLADLYRIRGDLFRESDPDNVGLAEGAYSTALELARRQQAKSWQLRAATHLARLWQGHGKQQEACDLLAPVYEWFTEGFDTADLQAARSLLEELG
jgi:class 3 adenylate cyclase/predicted ATPase